jgi:hypothetical protein
MPNHGMEHYYNKEAINVSKATNNDTNRSLTNIMSYNRVLSENHLCTH